MTGWTMSIFYLLTTAVLILLVAAGAIVLAVCLVKKKKLKAPVIFTASCLGALIAVGAFIGSHSTYIRYNDKAIMGSDISDIIQKYGKPDLWNNAGFEEQRFEEGRSGSLGYYIYTDNGPIMPDGLPHYYYIKYDEQGIVTEVYDGAHPGG